MPILQEGYAIQTPTTPHCTERRRPPPHSYTSPCLPGSWSLDHPHFHHPAAKLVDQCLAMAKMWDLKKHKQIIIETY